MTSIHTALTEFLDEQSARLSERTFRNYESVILHYEQMLIREGYAGLDDKKVRHLYDKVIAKGKDDDRAALFKAVSAKRLLENVEFFLTYHMRHKVIESAAVERAAPTVMKKLATFLADRKYVTRAAVRDAKDRIEYAVDNGDDDDYLMEDMWHPVLRERDAIAGDTIRLLPHDGYLPLILGQAEKLLLRIAEADEAAILGTRVQERLPYPLVERQAFNAVRRIRGVIRPLFDAPEGPALYAPDGRVKHPPLHLVKLALADVDMLVAAAEAIRWAWGPDGQAGPRKIQNLDTLLEKVLQGWNPADPGNRLEAVLTLDVDDDMRTLIEVVSTAAADVVLTADQESAYQRLIARLNTAMAPTFSDPHCPRCGYVMHGCGDYSAVSDEEICSRCFDAEYQDMEQGIHPDPRSAWPIHHW